MGKNSGTVSKEQGNGMTCHDGTEVCGKRQGAVSKEQGKSLTCHARPEVCGGKLRYSQQGAGKWHDMS